MTAFSIALEIDQGPGGMKDGIISVYRGVLMFSMAESVPGFKEIFLGCRELFLGEPFGSREIDDFPVF